MTGRAGLVPYLDLMAGLGLWRLADRRVGAGSGAQGWSDGQNVAALLLLNLAGGDCVEDIEMLEGDRGRGAVCPEPAPVWVHRAAAGLRSVAAAPRALPCRLRKFQTTPENPGGGS